jgi:hypothetical protein
MIGEISARIVAAWARVLASRVGKTMARAANDIGRVLGGADHAEPGSPVGRLLELREGLAQQAAAGDRWALAREIETLRAEGVRQTAIVAALTTCGICEPGVIGRKRCGNRIRSERRRFRRYFVRTV